MALVHATTHAYEHKEGWMDDAPPVDAIPRYFHFRFTERSLSPSVRVVTFVYVTMLQL